MSPRLFLIAGEVSGDIYGADLVAALRGLRSDLDLVAVGGPRMAAAGARCLLDSADWGVIGWVDVLARVPAFIARLARVQSAVAHSRPNAVVLVDFPGFNLELARRLRGAFPVSYFIPPMVTTWRGDRARRIARLGMRILAILPFEAEAYRAAGADVVFVGHPALDHVRTTGSREEVRARLGVQGEEPLLALLPGSRRHEVRRHLPVITAALDHVRRVFPAVHGVVVLASPLYRRLVDVAVRRAPIPLTVLPGGTPAGYDALAASDFAVVASGTATLEALCLGVPHVIIYRLSPVTYRTPLGDLYLRRRLAVPWVGLPSLLAGREVVPELLQRALTPARLAALVNAYLGDADRRDRQRRDLVSLRGRLGSPGAVDRAAREILHQARLLPSDGLGTIQAT